METINETKKIKNMAEFQRLSETLNTLWLQPFSARGAPKKLKNPKPPCTHSVTAWRQITPDSDTLNKTQRDWGAAVSSEPDGCAPVATVTSSCALENMGCAPSLVLSLLWVFLLWVGDEFELRWCTCARVTLSCFPA
jgi:hypothetical protein